MMKQKSVWIIEYGSYSDYRVIGPYSKKEYAQTIADKINASESYDEATVSERVLDPGINDMHRGYTLFDVDMGKNGDVSFVEKSQSITEFLPHTCIYRGLTQEMMHATVYAKDADHAVKIVNDRRFQFLALDMWRVGYQDDK